MASIKRNDLKNGISYRIIVKVKSPRTNKLETRSTTWKVPSGLNKQEIKQKLQEVVNEFERQEKQKETRFQMNNRSVKFKDFIDEWVEHVSINKSKNYYVKALQETKLIKDYFGDIKLSEINPVMVQGYMDHISKHKVISHSSKMIKSLKELLLSRIMKVATLVEISGVHKCTYESAISGNPIRYENAIAMYNALGVPYSEYFEDIKTEKNYAKETIKKHRNCLSAILSSAKKQGLIEDNYASPEYLEPIRGYKEEMIILNEEEAKLLMKELDKEPDPRKKISLIIVLLMGIRRGELAGLEWKDIDFENKTMTIQRTSYRDKGGTTYTKEPKTERSKRCITMPNKLIGYLLEYRDWWNNRKSILKLAWKNSDRLLLSDDGRIVCPTMYVKWLKRISDNIDIPKVTLHSLRHTNITLQMIAGVDTKTVSTRAGHARASTTHDIYAHFLKSSDKNASETLNKLFNREKGLYSGDNNQE